MTNVFIINNVCVKKEMMKYFFSFLVLEKYSEVRLFPECPPGTVWVLQSVA